MSYSDTRSRRPTFIQKRKWIGFTVILVLIAVGIVLVLGIALGVGVPAGLSQASRLEQSLNIDELMDMLTVMLLEHLLANSLTHMHCIGTETGGDWIRSSRKVGVSNAFEF